MTKCKGETSTEATPMPSAPMTISGIGVLVHKAFKLFQPLSIILCTCCLTILCFKLDLLCVCNETRLCLNKPTHFVSNLVDWGYQTITSTTKRLSTNVNRIMSINKYVILLGDAEFLEFLHPTAVLSLPIDSLLNPIPFWCKTSLWNTYF